MIDKSDIIITTESNPVLMQKMYAFGACAHENYMTKKEAEQLTSTWKIGLHDNTVITCMDEMRFFTGLTGNPWINIAHIGIWNKNMSYITVPDSVIQLSGSTPWFGYWNTSVFHRVIIGSGMSTIRLDLTLLIVTTTAIRANTSSFARPRHRQLLRLH